MSQLILRQIRKQRELTIPLSDRLKVIARRPSQLQMTELTREGRFSDLGTKYVIGWEGFIEDDFVGGGGSDKVAFDAELWSEYYADHVDCWEPISNAILEAYNAHARSTEDEAKNSSPG